MLRSPRYSIEIEIEKEKGLEKEGNEKGESSLSSPSG